VDYARRLNGDSRLLRHVVTRAVIQLLQAEPRFEPPTIHKDTAHHPRIAQAQRKG
jgi:hypothetical protein